MEASTGIEPVYTDLQSAASPLRQLANQSGSGGLSDRRELRKRPWVLNRGWQALFAKAFCGKTPVRIPNA